MLADAAGKPLRRWDARGQVFEHRYDALRRPTHLLVQQTKKEPPDLTPRLPPPSPPPPPPIPSTAQRSNLRGQAYRIYDCAGLVTNDSFDFKGNPLSSTRRLAANHRVEPSWNIDAGDGHDVTDLTDPGLIQAAAEDHLEPELVSLLTVFNVALTYDALNRVTSRTTPDGAVTKPTYNQAGLLERVDVAAVRGATALPLILNIDYNARGQRLFYEYANPTQNNASSTCKTEYQSRLCGCSKVTSHRSPSFASSGSMPGASLRGRLEVRGRKRGARASPRARREIDEADDGARIGAAHEWHAEAGLAAVC